MRENKKPSMEKMLAEMAEMIDKIKNYDKSLQPLESPGVAQANIDVLKKFIEILDKMVVEPLERQYDMDALTKETLESPSISSTDKQMVKQAVQASEEAKLLNKAFKAALAKNKARKKGKAGPKEEATTPEQIKERRKLFKSIGGDKKWIPM